ncbi:MAG: hypothetical protein HY762_04235, partial [Planctomycetes bacterium]|nr:hypothetical protein [Planctomycetota bacterium]
MMNTKLVKIANLILLIIVLLIGYGSFAMSEGVSGRVFDSATGNVISGAVVTLIA